MGDPARAADIHCATTWDAAHGVVTMFGESPQRGVALASRVASRVVSSRGRNFCVEFPMLSFTVDFPMLRFVWTFSI